MTEGMGKGNGEEKGRGEREKKRFYSIGRGINTARQVGQKKTINYFYRMEEKQT